MGKGDMATGRHKARATTSDKFAYRVRHAMGDDVLVQGGIRHRHQLGHSLAATAGQWLGQPQALWHRHAEAQLLLLSRDREGRQVRGLMDRTRVRAESSLQTHSR